MSIKIDRNGSIIRLDISTRRYSNIFSKSICSCFYRKLAVVKIDVGLCDLAICKRFSNRRSSKNLLGGIVRRNKRKINNL